MVPDTRAKATRICQCLGAITALALVAAQFENSPFRGPILHQRYALNYLRAGSLRETVDTPPRPPKQELSGGRAGFIGAPVRADFVGGFYNRPLKVTLTHSASAPIYYTLDGSLPTVKARRYSEPIAIDRTRVLRFASLPSGPEETHTYVIGDHGGLPVLSVAMDPSFLWNRHAGIYLNAHQRGKAWRRPAQAELFADRNSPAARFPAELKIHGNWSRHAEKKSFQLSYATGRVSGIDRTGVLARPGENAAQRTLVARATAIDLSYRLGDELFRSLFADSGGLIVSSSAVQLLLNGQAWGLYNIYEKISKDYLQRVHGAGEYDLVDDAGYRHTAEDPVWNRLLDFFLTHDLSNDDDFARAMQLIDDKNFSNYWLFNIYAGNLDWPQNNYYAFRNRSGDQRWRWISWDTDAAFDVNKGLRHDTLSWATRPALRHDLSYGGTETDDETWMASTAIIRGLLKNSNYQARFVRQFCELRNTFFQPDLLQARFQRLLDRMTPHLSVDWERWPASKQAYLAGVQGVRRFIAERPAIVLEQFRKRFRFSNCPAL
jgi:CotH protein/chitobiase/beta-hexosaminidase-like protein